MHTDSDTLQRLFSGRQLLVATKHRKEQVIGPALAAALGVRCTVAPGLDTDRFGTFTGERSRRDTALATARSKCLAALATSDCTLAVASEGSFGPHPTMMLVPADDEIVLLIDRRNGLEIAARQVSLDTNFNAAQVASEAELVHFAETAQFPSHALILRASQGDMNGIRKGITSWEDLLHSYRTLSAQHTAVHAETDMRAMHNPTRMRVIEAATGKLIETISSCCPACTTPGFSVVEVKRGLPCSLCGAPTQLAVARVYRCARCEYVREEPVSEAQADPRHCGYCNP